LPPSDWPAILSRSAPRLGRGQKRRYEELRRVRDQQAAKLGIEPSIIASRAALVSLAVNHGTETEELMRWQVALLTGDPGLVGAPAEPRASAGRAGSANDFKGESL
jgi:ribonuclease D